MAPLSGLQRRWGGLRAHTRPMVCGAQLRPAALVPFLDSVDMGTVGGFRDLCWRVGPRDILPPFLLPSVLAHYCVCPFDPLTGHRCFPHGAGLGLGVQSLLISVFPWYLAHSRCGVVPNADLRGSPVPQSLLIRKMSAPLPEPKSPQATSRPHPLLPA